MMMSTWAREVDRAKETCREAIQSANKKAFLELLNYPIIEVKVTIGSRVATLYSPRYMKIGDSIQTERFCFFDNKFLVEVRPRDLEVIRKLIAGYALEMGCTKLYRLTEVK